MLRQNIAGSLSQIGLNAVQPATVIDRNKGNLAEDLAKAYSGWDSANKKQAYIDALQGGNQEEIDSALANYNPEAYAQVMQAREQRANQLADADTQFARQKELANIQFNNNMALKRLEAALKPATAAQQNMQYLQQMGYSPEEAAQLYYSGQNPNATLPLLGEKGIKKYDENRGKNYATDLEEYENMVSKMPELLDTVANLDKVGANATYTTAGQALDSFRRQVGMNPRQSSKDRAAYISMIDNQVLPLLRDTFGAQFTEREGNTLRKTLGDPNVHPEEKHAQLSAFIRQKQMSIESKARKLQSYATPSLKQFQSNEEVIDWQDLK